MAGNRLKTNPGPRTVYETKGDIDLLIKKGRQVKLSKRAELYAREISDNNNEYSSLGLSTQKELL